MRRVNPEGEQSGVANRGRPDYCRHVKASSRTTQWLVFSVLAATCLLITGAFLRQEAERRGLGAKPMPVLGTLADFQLTNQLGQAVTLASLKGKVWVADIIFTRCAGPCPLITRQMVRLQHALPAHLPVRFVSLTTDAAFDTPAVLQRYGERFGVAADRFYFLTGAREEIHRVATSSKGGLMLVSVEKQPGERLNEGDLFVHSTRFVLVDKQGRIRAYFDGERGETEPVILASIRRLARESVP
jgi:cytochrome oxidase Cu insertion factor (SCO1/SenC/PrrC family)